VIHSTVSRGSATERTVSIIVAVRNGSSVLQRCIDSVSAQAHPVRELIIMDGGSTDTTVDMLKAYGDAIAYWESEQDHGVYHAWNKALNRATGNWICFLGADDQFANDYSLGDLVQAAIRREADLVSGRAGIVDSRGNIVRVVGEPWNWRRMKHHQVVAHPGMLHRRELFSRFGRFNDHYRVGGDYDFLLRVGPHVRTAFVDEIVVLMGASGISRKQLMTLFKEAWIIQAHHPEIGRFAATRNFLDALIKATGRRVLGIP